MTRAALVGLAFVVGLAAAGFLVAAAHAGLALLTGPVLASLIFGIILLLVAAILMLLARRPGQPSRPKAVDPGAGETRSPEPDQEAAGQEPQAADLLTPAIIGQVAVFTLFFVLARRFGRGKRGD